LQCSSPASDGTHGRLERDETADALIVSDPNSGGDREAAALLPENWRELAVLVDIALDAAPKDRAVILTKLSDGDPARLAVLERLVVECEREMPLLDRPAVERFPTLFSDDADAPMPAVLGGRYRIEREIGRGGMARVYLAHDIKHARDVAVKVIRPDLAASLGRDRFLREIAIAARLRHPNIVPLYDSGDADGVLYFVMPFEAGASLRARLDDPRVIPVGERLSVLRDVARALAYAHEQGVVHRDVKPDNVMLSGGAAVVTDFGIAKAITVAQGDASPATLTQSGMGIGTPAYMAPEQAVGDPSMDHRADIYSFGCLAYELFAGKPPFHGVASHEIISAHIATKPVPIAEASSDVPVAIAALITRCLAKNPADRPQSANELLVELEGTSTAPSPIARRRHLPRAALAAMLPIAVVLIAAGAYFATRTRGVAPTVTVLPLQSAAGDTLQRQLADGLSDEIATALFKVPGVRLMSRRGAGQYGGREVDPQKTGRALGANFLVMGSLREVDGRLRVLASLIDVRDGSVVWSDQYDRQQADLGLVRDEIARAVGEELRRTLGASVGRLADATPGRLVNPEAYRLYVLAQRALTHRGQSIQASVDLFRSATRLDSLYADAYSGLSLALALEPYFKPISTRAVAADVISAAQAALRLDSTLALPHVALGLVRQHAYDWDGAAEEFQTALRRRRSDDTDIEPLVQYGRHLLYRGRTKEALQQFLMARRTEPASALVSSWVAYAYYLDGQLDSALVESERAVESDSMSYTALAHGALVRLKAGRGAEAVALARRAPWMNPVVFYVLAAAGDTAAVRQRLDEVRRRQTIPWLQRTMQGYAMLGAGDTTKAIDAFERATDENEMWPSLQTTRDPMFDPIRGSARFRRLLQRVHLSASVP
jgi:serine/threonine-protein kinase